MEHSAQTERVLNMSWLTKLGISKSHRKEKNLNMNVTDNYVRLEM